LACRRADGSVLVVVLVLMVLVSALAAGALALATREVASTAWREEGEQLRYAAEAGLALGVSELDQAPGFTPVLSGTALSGHPAGPGPRVVPGGRMLDVGTLTASLQAATPDVGLNTPRWVPWVVVSLEAAAPVGPSVPALLVVWVADDEEDGDGRPLEDSNGVVRVRAAAFGPRFAQRAVEGAISRVGPPPGGLKLLAWQPVS